MFGRTFRLLAVRRPPCLTRLACFWRRVAVYTHRAQPVSATLMDSFIAVDVEIASRSPIHVCAIGAVRIIDGSEQEALRSLVSAPGRVHYSEIHGLAAADLVGAPAWPVVWDRLLNLLHDVRTVVAFRAAFDRGAILAMCGRHALRVPPLRFACAAEMAAMRCSRHLNLVETMLALGLPFPGRPHDPLADARAAAAIAIACTPWPAACRLR